MMRFNLAFVALFPLVAISGCVTLVPTGRGMLVVKPCFSSLTSQATIAPYTQASIQHLMVKLYKVDGGEQETAQADLLNAQLGNPITFSNLKANTTYRIKGYAYKASGTLAQDLISYDNASSSVDVTLTDDNRPGIASLTVALIDRLFDAQATSSLGIVPGVFSPLGSEGVISPVVVTTLAGNGTTGFVNGQGAAARFADPYAVAADGYGYVYVADTYNRCIRKINANGVVTTLAGNGTSGYVDGPVSTVMMGCPVALTLDSLGNLYFIDDSNRRIRKLDTNGIVSTLAGNGVPSFADGTGTQASFYFPYGIAVDAQGILYVGDGANHRIRKIDINNVVTTFAGDGTASTQDGTGTQARLNNPRRLALDPLGNLYFPDGSVRIRKVNIANGVVSTVAGDGTAGYLDGTGTQARFSAITDVAVDDQGNVYVADSPRVRKIDTNGIVSTLAGNGGTGFVNGIGTAASFNVPYGLGADPFGNVYVADRYNHSIRKIQ